MQRDICTTAERYRKIQNQKGNSDPFCHCLLLGDNGRFYPLCCLFYLGTCVSYFTSNGIVPDDRTMPDIDQTASREYDVIVVGAGPAGCSAAYFSALQGLNVLLLDKARFPRDKVCGDSISPRSLKILERMGLLEKIEKGDFFRNKGIILSSPDFSVMKNDIPKAKGQLDYGYVIPRKIFDNMLLLHVKDTSVTVMEGMEITSLLFEGKRVAGVKSSDGSEMKCKIVVGADGVYSRVAKNAGIYTTDPDHETIVARAYFRGVDNLEDYNEIHADSKFLPGYGWLFPINSSCANVGVGIIKTYLYKKEENLKSLFEYFISENPLVKKKLANAKMIGKLKAWPERFGSMAKNSYSNGVLLVGDAAGFVDSGSGEGIYQALRSGELAAEVIHTACSEGDFSKNTLKKYERKWKKDFSADFKYGRINAKTAVKNPLLLNSLVKKASRNESIAETVTGTFCGVYSKNKLYTPRHIIKYLFS